MLGTIARTETSLDVPEGYPYVGILAKGGALYLSSVTIGFAGASGPAIAYTGETEKALPDAAFELVFTLKNYDGDYAWSLVEGEGTLGEGGVYQWTATATGEYTIKVAAINGELLIAQKEVTLTVNKAVVKYQIECAVGIPNGSVSADKTEAEEGELVTLTAKPADGYKLDHFLLNGIAFTENPFPMPAEDVLVSAEFVEVTGDAFNLVTSVDDLEDGAEYVITDNSQAYAITAELTTTSTKRLVSTAVAPVDGVITTDDAAIVWKLVEDESGNFALYNDSIGKYIAWSSGNSAKFQDEAFANTISYEDDLFVVMATSTAELEKPRKLQFNASSSTLQFAYYEGAQKNLCFFKKESSTEPKINYTGETEKTLPDAELRRRLRLEPCGRRRHARRGWHVPVDGDRSGRVHRQGGGHQRRTADCADGSHADGQRTRPAARRTRAGVRRRQSRHGRHARELHGRSDQHGQPRHLWWMGGP